MTTRLISRRFRRLSVSERNSAASIMVQRRQLVSGGSPSPAPTPTPTPTTSQSSMALRGMELTFASAAPVGAYVLGDLFAVGATVNGDSPAYALDAAGSWQFGEDETVSLQATGDTVTKTGHKLVLDQKVRFSALGGATGISTGVDYFARTITANTFQIAATAGGAAIDITANGTNAVMRRYGVSARGRNGLMLNAGSNGSTGGDTQKQGYDSLDSIDAPGGSTIQDYDIALNVAPSRTSTPISGPASLTKVISTTAPNLEGRENLTQSATFTLVSDVPPSGSFRPHSSDTDKTPFFTLSDMDLSGLPSLALPSGTSLPTAAQVVSQLVHVQTQFTNNLFARGISASENQRSYGGDIAASIAQALCWLCVEGQSAPDRQLVAAHLAQIGLDGWRRTVNGGRWPSLNASFGGGQHWVKLAIVFAAWAFRNSGKAGLASLQAIADRAQSNFFQNDRTIITVDRTLIETTPNTGLLPVYAPFLDFMENAIDWNSKPSSPASGGSAFNHRYRDTNGNPNMPAIMALRAMGAISLWNAADTMAYHDRYFQWWSQNGFSTHRLITDQSATFLLRMTQTYYAAQSPELSSGAAPAAVRYEARNRHIWAEYDRHLDQSFVPATSAFAAVVAGSPVTLPIDRTTTANMTVNSATVVVASATGIFVGMRADLPNFPKPVQVLAVSGTSITLSTSASATATGQSVTFSAVHVWGKSVAVTLDTALTPGQSVTLAYTQPGSNQARALGGGLAPSFAATSATNRTGALPDAATTKHLVDVRKASGINQWSTMNVPASQTLRRLRGSVRFVIFARTANMTIISGGNSGTATLWLYASTTADMRMSIGTSHTFRMPGDLTALPLNTLITFHWVCDFTQTTAAATYRGVYRWNGGERVASITGSTGAFDGAYAPNIATLLSAPGLTLGAKGTGNDPWDGAMGELTLGWGDNAYTLPADFSGSEFAWDADWGGNGENPWGQNQIHFAGSVDEYNGGIPNRGNGQTLVLTPRNIDLATEDLAQTYVVWP